MNIEQILLKYPRNQRDFLIPLLQDVQEQEGYLPADTLPQIASHVGLPLVKIYSVATYYNQFQFEKLGRYHLQVCEGLTCHLNDGWSLAEELYRMLDIRDGEMTQDQLFSLELVPCLGACHLAPVLAVNGVLHGRLTARKLQALLDAYKD